MQPIEDVEVKTVFTSNVVLSQFFGFILGWFGDFLSWRGFQFFTKISYAVYLVQFPVFFYNVGITRHVGEFKPRMIVSKLLSMREFVHLFYVHFRWNYQKLL